MCVSSQGPAKSGLRPPSKIQLPSSPTRNGLCELAESAANARGAKAPPTGPVKHKPTGRKVNVHQEPARLLTGKVPEPPTKLRKTLQERAGEPLNSKLAAPTSSRPVNGAIKASTTNGMRPFSASTSRAPSTNTSKHAPANPFSGSVGYGNRIPSANSYNRSKSAYGHGRSKSQHQASRPATSMTEHEEEEKPERTGAYTLSISTNPRESRDNFLQLVKPCGKKSRIVSAPIVQPSRAVSATPTRVSSSFLQSTFSTSPVPEEPTNTDCEEILDGLGALSLGSSAIEMRRKGIGRGKTSGKDSVNLSSKYRTSIPRAMPSPQSAPFTTIRPSGRSGCRPFTPSKPTPRFLNRFTNDFAPVFDTESRMQTMEREFAAFKQRMEDGTSQANDLKETIKILQTRGK